LINDLVQLHSLVIFLVSVSYVNILYYGIKCSTDRRCYCVCWQVARC